MSTTEGRDWKGIWIPRSIWEHADLTWYDKIVLMEVDSFTQRAMDCFVSDKHLAKFVGVSERTIRKSINRLEGLSLLERLGFDGRKRYMRSLLPSNAAGAAKQYGKSLLPAGHEVPKKKPITETNEKTIIFPWDDDEFKALWSTYKAERRANKRKPLTATGEQTALHMLQKDSNNNRQAAVEAIQRSIAHGYQGIFIDKKYKARTTTEWDGEALDSWANG